MQMLNTLTQLQHAILDRRKKLKLSQAMVAAKLGISQNRYSELEKSVANIDVDRLLHLLSILGLALHLGLKAEPLLANNDSENW
jgi:HTH-type transcriptional regulator / antitoxin HipB